MIFLNLKTTGPDSKIHGIIGIGAVEYENPCNFFYETPRLEKDKKIEFRALEDTGFKEYELKDPSKKSLGRVLKEFLDWVERIHKRNLVEYCKQNIDFLRTAMEEASLVVPRETSSEELAKMLERGKKIWPFGDIYIDLQTTAINTYHEAGFSPELKDSLYKLTFEEVLESVDLSRAEGPFNALEDALLEAEAYCRLACQRIWCRDFGTEFTLKDLRAKK